MPKPTFSFLYALQIIDIHAGPPRSCLGGIFCTLDESSTLVSLSDSSFAAVLCLVLFLSRVKTGGLLTSMPKQHTKHNVTSPSASIPNTDAQTNVSVSGAAVYRRAIIHRTFQASVVYV